MASTTTSSAGSTSSNDKYALTNTFTHTTSTHRFEIRWLRVGEPSNPPLILIHGTPWSTFVWHDLVTALERHYCVYIYDHPGFEDSPQIVNLDGSEASLDPTLELRAEASARLIESWDLDGINDEGMKRRREGGRGGGKAHVVAHDNAGLVTLRLILNHGLSFKSVLFFDVVAVPPFGSSFFTLVADNHHVFQDLPPDFGEGFVRAYIRSAAHTSLSSDIEDRLAAQWLAGGKQGFRRFLQEMLQAHKRSTAGLEERYKEVGASVPVKILWGQEDSWIKPDKGRQLSEMVGAREFVVVEGAAHLMQFDQPGKLAVEIALWLAMNDG